MNKGYIFGLQRFSMHYPMDNSPSEPNATITNITTNSITLEENCRPIPSPPPIWQRGLSEAQHSPFPMKGKQTIIIRADSADHIQPPLIASHASRHESALG